MTLSGIDPTTFQFVVQRLNHYAAACNQKARQNQYTQITNKRLKKIHKNRQQELTPVNLQNHLNSGTK
jgi:hypothetical protein